MTRCQSRPRSRCSGMTRCSKQCRCKPKRGARYCHKHESLYRYDKPKECCICFEELTAADRPTKCGHYMHSECLQRWCSANSASTCPVCRAAVETPKDGTFRIHFDLLPEDLQQSLLVIYEGLRRLVESSEAL